MFEAGAGLVNRGPWRRSTSGRFLTSLWRGARGGLLRWLAPQACALCGGSGQPGRGEAGLDLCIHCEAALPRRAGQEGLGEVAGRELRLLAPFEYRPPADFMIRELKFHGALCQARVLGELLAEAALAAEAPLPEVLVPVPLHWERLRERGYNQAAEIARQAARRLRLPMRSRCLERRRDTAAQSGLAAAARPGNVAGAFGISPRAAGRVRGLRIALVDDVVTTGSTAREAAACLLAAGAAGVEVWAACRAGRP